jgi:hypothetical protein
MVSTNELPQLELKTYSLPGTDVMILKKYFCKKMAKILAFFAQTTSIFSKI